MDAECENEKAAAVITATFFGLPLRLHADPHFRPMREAAHM